MKLVQRDFGEIVKPHGHDTAAPAVRREAEVLDYKVPRGAIYIGRPMPDLPGTKWANPLKLRRHF